MSGEEDATREIFGYTSHIPVPVWVDKNAYSACKHCQQKFSQLKEATKSHHCRLCGDMFCGSCTGRYHIPLVYEQKSKKGATRVCIGCRDSCLSQKDREKNATLAQQPQKHAVLSSKDLNGPIGAAAIRPSQFVGGPTPIEIAPPQWDDPDKFSDCAKCHKKGGKLHNCRTCGHLFDDNCTSKMLLPPYFEKKKKVGPARVCGECRFKILGGAKLVERLSTDLPELDTNEGGASSGGNGGVHSTTGCIVPGCVSVRVSKNGYCAVHVNEFGTGGADLATSASLAIRWDGSSSILTRVALTDKHMNLLQIDVAFKRQCTEFAQRTDWEYLYKNEGIAQVFFDIFNASHFAGLGHQILIRQRIDTDLLVAQYARQGTSGRATAAVNGRMTMAPTALPSINENGAPNISNNPFKRNDHATNLPSPTSSKKTNPPPPPLAKTNVFQKPKLVTLPPPASISASSTNAKSSKAQPPPPPPAAGVRPPQATQSTAATIPAGLAGPEVFKARAKLYFGAL